jgi:hypothetical protein
MPGGHGRLTEKISPKGTRFSADKQIKAKMLPGLTTVSLPQIYCRSCHLSTRADVVRCLHCNRPLQPPPAAPKRAVRRTKPVRRTH